MSDTPFSGCSQFFPQLTFWDMEMAWLQGLGAGAPGLARDLHRSFPAPLSLSECLLSPSCPQRKFSSACSHSRGLSSSMALCFLWPHLCSSAPHGGGGGSRYPCSSWASYQTQPGGFLPALPLGWALTAPAPLQPSDPRGKPPAGGGWAFQSVGEGGSPQSPTSLP